MVLPGEERPLRRHLFSAAPSKLNFFPEFVPGLAAVLAQGKQEGCLGVDLEYRGSVPKVLGIASLHSCSAIPWTDAAARAVVEAGVPLVGHAVVSSDKPKFDERVYRTPLDRWEDTLLEFYLLHQQMTKMPGKKEDEEDQGVMGLMNLWSMTSTYTMLPNWKNCRGPDCFGPCPTERVLEYCATDAWASRWCHEVMVKDLASWEVPRPLYRELVELDELCYLMQLQGVAINRQYIKDLEAKADAIKESLFPPEVFVKQGLSKETGLFNPRSPSQTLAWFKHRGEALRSTDIEEVVKALGRVAKRHGYQDLEALRNDRADDTPLPEVLDALLRLHDYKASGKGLKAWFDESVIANDGLIHPRFSVTGTSTGRLSSSRPNFQNVPVRGFGKLVRGAIVPRSPDLVLLKADFSQLELRMCLWLSGMDLSTIGRDPFVRLVEQSGGAFKNVPNLSERNVAKRAVHAGDYMEGIVLLDPHELETPTEHLRKDLDSGALLVYSRRFMPDIKKDWTFGPWTVAFTGSNLADVLFGDHTRESRRRALDIQRIHFDAFPSLRPWQQSVLAELEARSYVKSPTGRFLRFNLAEQDKSAWRDAAKIALAFKGSGVAAEHVQAVQLRLYKEMGVVPLLQVHDELVVETPKEEKGNRLRRDIVTLMEQETKRFNGFKAPIKALVGDCWLEEQMEPLC